MTRKSIHKIQAMLGFEKNQRLKRSDVETRKVVRTLRIKNYSREILVELFIEEFSNHHPNRSISINVAVVGGDDKEPELLALRALGYRVDAKIFGIAQRDDFYLDLNLQSGATQKEFDLVLCSQVLEHVWNLETAFLNLIALMKRDGLLWVSCPASNRFHGSPDFYSAGFSEEFLRRIALRFDLCISKSGSLGTRRNYVATHLLDVWLSPRGHRWPMIFAFDSKSLLVRMLLTVRFCAKLILIQFHSGRLGANPRYATETWILARKI